MWKCLREKNITLLDRLHRKRNANPALVTEEVMVPDSPTQLESNMDSTLEVSQSESSKSIPPNLRSKGVKLDFDCDKPSSVSKRDSSKGFILKRRSESVQYDHLIKMPPPKRKRSSHESRS
ncbi:unnamed protein product [Lactuca virosa]|uniref:Shugoshin C-terminal domain-containing protein n=1 Tax=Lactuca virosa TaxID=75947 RepID=A0AAU9PES5_9ASTR|nr:unnamed protein product [Lactuca virosa]